VLSPTLYVEAQLAADCELALPDDHEERAIYVVSGSILVEEQEFTEGQLVIFGAGAASLRATSTSRVMLLGGARLDGERHIWWNFVSSDEERIEQAKRDWRAGRFGTVRGDEHEFIPLPEER
jgi:redox-sensitive bicupin YhaK (pirin superfamily)